MGIYLRPESPHYWMSLQVKGKRVRVNTGISDRRVAEELFAGWKVELARVRWLGPPQPESDRTLHELIHAYLLQVTPRKSLESQQRDCVVFRHLPKAWDTVWLNELTPKMIDDYMSNRLKTVCFATVSKELGILKSAYRYAIRWGWANTNPIAGISLNQEGEGRLRWLTREEESRLLLACSPWLQAMVVVGFDTGLRRANLVGLQREWVHNDGKLLIIPRQHMKVKKIAVAIPLTTRAAKIIRAQGEMSSSPYIFSRQDGRPYSYAAVSTAFARSACQAGLLDVSLHTLRHTFISRLVQAGRPLAEVAALAGHRDIRMTLRYSHLAPKHLEQSIQALEPLVVDA
ncbi:MAG: tyrosine-type recombinase/integrase [Nitrospirales bacterium]